MTELMQDASLKPFGKHLGPFAAFKRDEAGDGVCACCAERESARLLHLERVP